METDETLHFILQRSYYYNEHRILLACIRDIESSILDQNKSVLSHFFAVMIITSNWYAKFYCQILLVLTMRFEKDLLFKTN